MKNVIISFKNLEQTIRDAIKQEYPLGYEHLVKKYTMPNKSFYAFPFVTTDTNYLIKVDVTIDSTLNLDSEQDEENDPDLNVELSL